MISHPLSHRDAVTGRSQSSVLPQQVQLTNLQVSLGTHLISLSNIYVANTCQQSTNSVMSRPNSQAFMTGLTDGSAWNYTTLATPCLHIRPILSPTASFQSQSCQPCTKPPLVERMNENIRSDGIGWLVRSSLTEGDCESWVVPSHLVIRSPTCWWWNPPRLLLKIIWWKNGQPYSGHWWLKTPNTSLSLFPSNVQIAGNPTQLSKYDLSFCATSGHAFDTEYRMTDSFMGSIIIDLGWENNSLASDKLTYLSRYDLWFCTTSGHVFGPLYGKTHSLMGSSHH